MYKHIISSISLSLSSRARAPASEFGDSAAAGGCVGGAEIMPLWGHFCEPACVGHYCKDVC